ncbi:glycosyltransferase family 4 protein [Glacieibacterium sp.]|uniref:glycosyltransferase family 4 protein n=1 Tax=Glacieibacterium sp. TaxID=2860237 RepID=UPI003B003992
MSRALTIGVEATAFSVRRSGISNYIINLLAHFDEVAGDIRLLMYSHSPLDIPELPRAIARKVGRPGRGIVWRNTGLASALRADQPDVFWGANGLLPIIRPRRMRTVVTVYDLVYLLAGDASPWVNRLTRRFDQPYSVRVADRVMAISRSTAADMTQVYGRAPDEVILPIVSAAYKPQPQAAVAVVRHKYALPAEYLLTIGTLEPRKNLVSLIRAMLRLQEQGVFVPPLIVAGGRGWLDGEITRAVAAAETAGVARTLGYVDELDMPALYSGAAYFVFAPLYEGFGMPVVEAQMCGTAVIASDIASLREASAGYATFFSPTVEGIAACLAKLATNPAATPRRPVDSIDNDPMAAAARLWSVMRSTLD